MSEAKERDERKFLTESECASLRDKIEATSFPHVAGEVGAGEMSVTKALAAVAVQRGTIALIRAYLAK